MYYFAGAQNHPIGSVIGLTVSPTVLTPTNNIEVIAKTSFAHSGCSLITTSNTVTGYTVNVYSKHPAGMLTTPCSSTNTITIGTLQPGAYCLLYHLYHFNYINNTDFIDDVDTICFTVDQPTLLPEYFQTNKAFVVYPNPATSHITINPLNNSSENIDVEFFDLYGQKLVSLKQTDPKIPIDIANFPNGTYILTVSNNDITQRTKIIKNTP